MSSSTNAPSSPFRIESNLPARSTAVTPRSKTPFVFPQASPFGRKQASATPSPSKKTAISPSKTNYFSPAKSKLRNAIVNPTFVGEAKLKRKREDELIGFRAIGDHGRTTLQRMLDVQRQPRTKPVAVRKAKGVQLREQNVTSGDGLNHQSAVVLKRQKRSTSFSSELPDTSSDEDQTDLPAPMHVLLSSANADLPASLAENEISSFSIPVYPLPPAIPSGAAEGAEDQTFSDRPNTVDSTSPEAFDGMPYTPTQIISTQPVIQQRDDETLPKGNSPIEEDIPVNDQDKLSPEKSRRGVRFRSEPEIRTTSPAFEVNNEPTGNEELAGHEVASVSESSPNARLHLAKPALTPAVDFETMTMLTSSQRVPTSEGLELQVYQTKQWLFARSAPTLFELLHDLDSKQLPHILYRDPYWSNLADVPQHAFEYAGRRYTHQGDANKHLQAFENATAHYRYNRIQGVGAAPILGIRSWDYARAAPTVSQLSAALADPSRAQAARVESGTCKLAKRMMQSAKFSS